MEFKVIKVSESDANWPVEDREYAGIIPGFVGGFNFEIADKNGNLDYMSSTYISKSPTDFINNLGYDYFEVVKWNGYAPTGRVVFRGYAIEYYDSEEKEWFVEDSNEEALKVYNSKVEGVKKMTKLEELKKSIEDNNVAEWIVNNFYMLPDSTRCDSCPHNHSEEDCDCPYSEIEDMEYWLNQDINVIREHEERSGR